METETQTLLLSSPGIPPAAPLFVPGFCFSSVTGVKAIPALNATTTFLCSPHWEGLNLERHEKQKWVTLVWVLWRMWWKKRGYITNQAQLVRRAARMPSWCEHLLRIVETFTISWLIYLLLGFYQIFLHIFFKSKKYPNCSSLWVTIWWIIPLNSFFFSPQYLQRQITSNIPDCIQTKL